jgi:SAM-dependent methyltransferase
MSEPYITDAAVMAAVKERYASAARRSLDVTQVGGGCCGPSPADRISSDLYDVDQVPSQGALTASLGCGNPTALIDLRPGQDVLDLGSGGGLDVLLSARRVAPGGTAYGVDMTDEMLELALRNKAEAGVTNATFLKGAIENVPLPDAVIDVVISNCVINLSSNKDATLAEAYRVLRPAGRFAVSDIVLLRPLEPALASIVALWTGCIAGALLDTDYVSKLTSVGFTEASVEITRRYDRSDIETLALQLTADDIPAGLDIDQVIDSLDGAFASAFIRATKPSAA